MFHLTRSSKLGIHKSSRTLRILHVISAGVIVFRVFPHTLLLLSTLSSGRAVSLTAIEPWRALPVQRVPADSHAKPPPGVSRANGLERFRVVQSKFVVEFVRHCAHAGVVWIEFTCRAEAKSSSSTQLKVSNYNNIPIIYNSMIFFRLCCTTMNLHGEYRCLVLSGLC